MEPETIGGSRARPASESARPAPSTVDAPDLPRVYSIDEFCDAYHLSRSFYYRLRNTARGPRETRLGRKVIVTVSDAREWEERMRRQHHTAGPNQ
ncbi:hypothetical protein [Paraburkholderia caffeinilytica]|uniref:hypothetical protein n=1 Tax=Paraburkholderia caffeinilytica TaxID=1761016 RepID=UPI003DA0F1FE